MNSNIDFNYEENHFRYISRTIAKWICMNSILSFIQITASRVYSLKGRNVNLNEDQIDKKHKMRNHKSQNTSRANLSSYYWMTISRSGHIFVYGLRR